MFISLIALFKKNCLESKYFLTREARRLELEVAQVHPPMGPISKQEIPEEASAELKWQVEETELEIKVGVEQINLLKPPSKCVWIILSRYVRLQKSNYNFEKPLHVLPLNLIKNP